MAEDTPETREELLRREYFGQTARIQWHELQTHFARGAVVVVAEGLDLVEVAVQLGLDNTERFQGWIDEGEIAAPTEEQALAWFKANTDFWAVVAAPWVLVQASN
ncbi:MAG: DUF2288 domain-containing protein [Halioglobus sp.]